MTFQELGLIPSLSRPGNVTFKFQDFQDLYEVTNPETVKPSWVSPQQEMMAGGSDDNHLKTTMLQCD